MTPAADVRFECGPPEFVVTGCLANRVLRLMMLCILVACMCLLVVTGDYLLALGLFMILPFYVAYTMVAWNRLEISLRGIAHKSLLWRKPKCFPWNEITMKPNHGQPILMLYHVPSRHPIVIRLRDLRASQEKTIREYLQNVSHGLSNGL